jgi:hypothetical protein
MPLAGPCLPTRCRFEVTSAKRLTVERPQCIDLVMSARACEPAVRRRLCGVGERQQLADCCPMWLAVADPQETDTHPENIRLLSRPFRPSACFTRVQQASTVRV